MTLSNIAKRALSQIDWGRAENYTTAKGKTKVIRTGIPTKTFWTWYKYARAELHQFGVTVRPCGTVTTYNKKGQAVKRKSWEATCWRADNLEGIGIQ